MAHSSDKNKKKVVEVKGNAMSHCNLVGSSKLIRHVVGRKFKSDDKKTTSEWKIIFKKQGLI